MMLFQISKFQEQEARVIAREEAVAAREEAAAAREESVAKREAQAVEVDQEMHHQVERMQSFDAMSTFREAELQRREVRFSYAACFCLCAFVSMLL